MAQTITAPQAMNLHDVMTALRVRSKATIYTWVKAGKLPAPTYIGRTPLWRTEDISALLAGGAA